MIIGFLRECYHGSSLDQIIDENDIQNNSLPTKWAMQIGIALNTLHDNGRGHLDIKSSNVLGTLPFFSLDLCGKCTLFCSGLANVPDFRL